MAMSGMSGMSGMSSMGGTVVLSATDPTSMLNTQLASALSTLGDAQFWEETISPATIRSELSSSDPSNPNSTPTLLKGMKWLLASISKGRDVSDFYPHVVKLVGATNMEVRKMVYMYLVQYADHDATTRELSLLSINSFQRGLADQEQWIRALALRVLSSIRIADILQIQILGVQKCAKDRSPYVRKCAANALSKLAPRCTDSMQKEMLLEIMRSMLDTDQATMVLSSALLAFCEMCPDRLEWLHASFRKICHLLTDMDEWGQVAILDLLSRYCRKYFQEPQGWKSGTAETIDRERRVRRHLTGIAQEGTAGGLDIIGVDTHKNNLHTNTMPAPSHGGFRDAPSSGNTGGFSDSVAPQKIKRLVIQKGFYSDEENESGEEVYMEGPSRPTLSTTGAMRQRNILGLPGVVQPVAVNVDVDGEEDMDLDEDHKLLLQSSIPLLKSRNAGVVLGVCSLLYYCGVSSVKTRSAMGKALVRIHRGRREIQYVVLTSIRSLVVECPSAFAPFLHDFFVKALDPPHTRIIKIDILVSLALEPAAIEVVLKEIRTYVRNVDRTFVCAAIRAVGRVAELARIVYDRHGQKSGDMAKERKTSNRVALDCLYGLAVVTQTADSRMVSGEAVSVMQSILVMLQSDAGAAGSLTQVDDPNDVQSFALRRMLLLLVNTLSNLTKKEEDMPDDGSDDDEVEPSDLEKVSSDLPPRAVASSLWIIGEWMSNMQGSSIVARRIDATTKSKMRSEILRLVDSAFPELEVGGKDQALHFASKVIMSTSAGTMPPSSGEIAMCEHILSMGRIDVNPDVKDRARMESGILQAAVGLKHDRDNLDSQPISGKTLILEDAKVLLLQRKPAPSFLPIKDAKQVDKSSFRFGTLSSLVGHQARGTYLPLPPWGEKNSPKSLRDPLEAAKEQVSGVPTNNDQGSSGNAPGFYGPNESSSSDSTSDDSSSSESSGAQNADSESDSDSDDSSSSSSNEGGNRLMPEQQTMAINGVATNNLLGSNLLQSVGHQPTQAANVPSNALASQSSGSHSSSSDDSSSSSSDDDYNGDVSSPNIPTPREGNLLSMGSGAPSSQTSSSSMFGPGTATRDQSSSSAMDDFKGLVMAPVAVDDAKASNPDGERDSSAWAQLVRPELSGGLSIRVRYLRGPTKTRELQLKGLDPQLPNVVCVEVQFGNKKSDANSLRRIRITSRSSPSGSVPVKKVLCPPEISELKKGQVANATLCILFAKASDREGDILSRFNIHSATGGAVPVELKPSLGELLVLPKAHTIGEFDATFARLHGFNRVTSKFQSNDVLGLPLLLMKHAALTPVETLKWKDNKLRLIGGLPASNELVLIQVQCDPTSGAGVVTVCCDHAVAVNSMMNVMKHAIAH